MIWKLHPGSSQPKNTDEKLQLEVTATSQPATTSADEAVAASDAGVRATAQSKVVSSASNLTDLVRPVQLETMHAFPAASLWGH